MPKLSKTIEVETAFAKYKLDEVLGEGGAGRVYGGVNIAVTASKPNAYSGVIQSPAQ